MTVEPSNQLIGYWVQAMQACEPFARMDKSHLHALAACGQERYAAPGALILGPDLGVPQELCWIRQGSVIGYPQGMEDQPFELEAGSLWPVAALLAERPVRTRYVARDDCFYFCFEWTRVQQLMARSTALADHLRELGLSLLQASARQLRLQLQARYQQAVRLEQPLSSLPDKEVLTLPESATLQQAMEAMHLRRVGSVLLTDASGHLSGILTRDDVIGRVVLPRLSLDEPVSRVMSQPVEALESTRSQEDAAVLMSRRSIRHVPVLRGSRVINLVSERDLFSLQRQSLRHAGALVSQARSVADLKSAAGAIRALAVQLLAQGTAPVALTRLLSDLNDKLTVRVIEVVLAQRGLTEGAFCWVALGSEGRQEQTIATDQDNALVFASDQPALDRPRWQSFARQVNETLDACGFPLCRGGIMASSEAWCHTLPEWRQLSANWIERGAPEDLLKSAVWFDLRALYGPAAWIDELRQDFLARVKANPRFIRQWVEQHLQTGVALNWFGGLATENTGGRETLDIKHAGTAIAVEAARILALTCGLSCTSTVERLQYAGRQLGIPEAEYQGWVTAFMYLQTLRLRQQILATDAPDLANRLDAAHLNLVDRQMIKSAFRAIRTLQQRLQMDHMR